MAVDLFDGLADDEVARLKGACKQARYAAGQVVFAEGDGGDEVFVVEHGRVRISKDIAVEVDRTLAIVERGGVFGELALVGAEVRSATATAVEPTDVLVLTRDGFGAFAAADPALGLKVVGRFAAILADRLQATTDLLRDTVRWGLEVSGAAALGLHRILQARAAVEVRLVTGDHVAGRLLKVERADGGPLLVVADHAEGLHLVPYHAVASLRVGRALLAQEV